MFLLSFGVNSVFFYIPALFYLLAYALMSFPKCSLSIFLKMLMFSKDLLKFHCVKILGIRRGLEEASVVQKLKGVLNSLSRLAPLGLNVRSGSRAPV
jgi:hypothetical protein